MILKQKLRNVYHRTDITSYIYSFVNRLHEFYEENLNKVKRNSTISPPHIILEHLIELIRA
ncbi:hypothetical protein BpHYR1_021120 [Brachionus plicatilis]|uniref:Uncharacterized protein n=1 Tax=Brachionus plicatilis TaxID=10195 RepID=A0A3M7SDN7_BRAPC|nr:hypothetical protein BpHYR1_021120 [Brachionus plicatilis]